MEIDRSPTKKKRIFLFIVFFWSGSSPISPIRLSTKAEVEGGLHNYYQVKPNSFEQLICNLSHNLFNVPIKVIVNCLNCNEIIKITFNKHRRII